MLVFQSAAQRETELNVIHAKMRRLSSGGSPRVLDLFAGCGGLSLGFHAAGFHIVGAVELDPDAATSHSINFHSGAAKHAQAYDITQTSPDQLASDLGLGDTNFSVDVLIGGPPCQAFARVGRPKLREIESHPEAFRHDPRARLYQDYLRYVDAFRPLAILIENVPDVLNHGGQNIAEEICEVLAGRGYVCSYTLLNSAFYGVPQMRERMFLLAYHEELGARIKLPRPSHWIELPRGYESSRAVALKSRKENPAGARRYIPPPASDRNLTPAVTARDALADLPPIRAIEELEAGRLRKRSRTVAQFMAYPSTGTISDYARSMRSWTGWEQNAGVSDHVVRYLPRDYPIFARMRPGDQYPEAHAVALDLFNEALDASDLPPKELRPGATRYEELKRRIVPPYDVSKFPNKWRKMWPDQPARTLMAHLGKDSYSHIHYDSSQSRTISVREAARLQSFPDGFVFHGAMNSSFRQIGNAVPPLMAKAIAIEIFAALHANQEEQGYVSESASSTVRANR